MSLSLPMLINTLWASVAFSWCYRIRYCRFGSFEHWDYSWLEPLFKFILLTISRCSHSSLFSNVIHSVLEFVYQCHSWGEHQQSLSYNQKSQAWQILLSNMEDKAEVIHKSRQLYLLFKLWKINSRLLFRGQDILEETTFWSFTNFDVDPILLSALK